MTPQLRDALPWIIVLAVVLLLLAFFGWLGYSNWSDDIT